MSRKLVCKKGHALQETKVWADLHCGIIMAVYPFVCMVGGQRSARDWFRGQQMRMRESDSEGWNRMAMC
jgi:hypothetical protein